MRHALRWWLLAGAVAGVAGVGWLAGSHGQPVATVRPAAGDVTAFGAVGDGTADDTAAVQRAADAGGTVRFPRGTFRFTRPVVIDLDRVGFTALVGDGTARVVMAGAGPAFRFVGTHAGTAAPQTVKDNVWRKQRTPTVDGLEVVGAHPDGDGLEATGTVQLTVTRLVVRECRHGVHLTGRNRNVILADCHLYHNRGAGVYYDDVNLHQSNIVGCHISYNAGGGIVARAGDVRNIQIAGCDIEANQGRDGPPTANVLIDSTGGRAGAAEVAITGCTLQHGHAAPGSANVRVLGRSGSGREGHVTITGNVLSDVQVNVHLRDCRGVTVTGNTFWAGHAHDLLVEDSSNVVVGPNDFDRNPRYDPEDPGDSGVVVRNSADCTLTGLHVNGVRHAAAGLIVENCRRINVTGCTVLDCDGAALLFKDVSDSRVSGCLVRDDRPESRDVVAVRLTGGRGNLVAGNLFGGRAEIDPAAAVADGNHGGR